MLFSSLLHLIDTVEAFLSDEPEAEQAIIQMKASENWQTQCAGGLPQSRSTFPFFIFECEYSIIQKVPAAYPSQPDVLQDYSHLFNSATVSVRMADQQTLDKKSKVSKVSW